VLTPDDRHCIMVFYANTLSISTIDYVFSEI